MISTEMLTSHYYMPDHRTSAVDDGGDVPRMVRKRKAPSGSVESSSRASSPSTSASEFDSLSVRFSEEDMSELWMTIQRLGLPPPADLFPSVDVSNVESKGKRSSRTLLSDARSQANREAAQRYRDRKERCVFVSYTSSFSC